MNDTIPHKLRSVFLDIVSLMASKPEALGVTATSDSRGGFIAIRITPAPEDMPGLIGRQGTNAKALRILAQIAAEANGRTGGVYIIEPQHRTPGAPFADTKPDWDAGPVIEAAKRWLRLAQKNDELLFIPDRNGRSRFVTGAALTPHELSAFGQVLSCMAQRQGSGPIALDVESRAGTTV